MSEAEDMARIERTMRDAMVEIQALRSALRGLLGLTEMLRLRTTGVSDEVREVLRNNYRVKDARVALGEIEG